MFLYPVKPMLPTLVSRIPNGNEWVYEPKYDGYRAQLIMKANDDIKLFSRNLRDLTEQFPEILVFAKKVQEQFSPFFPLVLDGEICLLENEFKAGFDAIQIKGRTKKPERIKKLAIENPAVFVAFDVLYAKHDLRHLALSERRVLLETIVIQQVNAEWQNSAILCMRQTRDSDSLWRLIEEVRGEGIVAKKSNSRWEAGKRTNQWVKIKNPQIGVFILTAFNKQNGFFHVGLVKDGVIAHVGLFTNGLNSDEREALITTLNKNSVQDAKEFMTVKPSICVELAYLEWTNKEIRQPSFRRFRFDVRWEDCQWERMRNNKPL